MRVFILLLITFCVVNINAQNNSTALSNMKMNAGIVTNKIQETKEFYTKYLQCGVSFENDFYLLLHTANHQAELSFLKAHHPSQNAMFQTPFEGNGVYLTFEVDNVDEVYRQFTKTDIEIHVDIRDEPWGDRHFSIKDPNGVGIDIVTCHQPEN